MHINEGLGVFWTAIDRAQIGLDPRTGAALDNFSAAEIELVDALTQPHTDVEYWQRAHALKIPRSRAQQIVALLDSANLLSTDLPHLPDCAAYWRVHHATPTHRAAAHVHIPVLDSVGVATAICCARAGIGTITTADATIVSPRDHSALTRQHLGIRKNLALTTALREENPAVHTISGSLPTIVVLTNSYGIDPQASVPYTARHIPVLHAWVEEVDSYLGPLTIAHETPCATCINLHHIDANPDWAVLAPQAFAARPIVPESSTVALLAALCTREVLTEIDGYVSPLRKYIYRIPPAPEPAELLTISFHPRCGCSADRAPSVSAPAATAPSPISVPDSRGTAQSSTVRRGSTQRGFTQSGTAQPRPTQGGFTQGTPRSPDAYSSDTDPAGAHD
ncbi:MAG: ThiF family adenylyltransferase [Arcanobacterium sp.]|nr:ThiF family adenylyltransferase [Arcanobacterium sp.]